MIKMLVIYKRLSERYHPLILRMALKVEYYYFNATQLESEVQAGEKTHSRECMSCLHQIFELCGFPVPMFLHLRMDSLNVRESPQTPIFAYSVLCYILM